MFRVKTVKGFASWLHSGFHVIKYKVHHFYDLGHTNIVFGSSLVLVPRGRSFVVGIYSVRLLARLSRAIRRTPHSTTPEPVEFIVA